MTSRPKKAEPRPQPRLYLVTPPIDDAQAFAAPLEAALAAGDVAAVLVRLAPSDERTLINRAKAMHNQGTLDSARDLPIRTMNVKAFLAE